MAVGNCMRMSKLYAPTLKEAPSEAELASHKLLLRAGMIRKHAAGIYSYLPLGYKVLKKIEDIIREEMDAIGAQEILMPALQPAELWHESGRFDNYGPELMKVKDRHERDFCLGPTHEELIIDLVRNELKSYKQLPAMMYQIQTKYRDEIRPRFGLLRSREFIMKDLYSFHTDRESLRETYDEVVKAYCRYCERLDLDYRPVQADAGQIGGDETIEFMALADSGEAELLYCDCGYAANVEAAHTQIEIKFGEAGELKEVETPGANTIEKLSEMLDVSPNTTIKAMAVKNKDGKPFMLCIPGDYDLNEVKVENLIGDYELLDDDDFKALGMTPGYIGPVGLPKTITLIADISLKGNDGWICGANKENYHYMHAKPGRDFQEPRFEDLVVVKSGDPCPKCNKKLKEARGIEVSQTFMLGTKYSDDMNALYTAEDGKEYPMEMGCYGIGVSRSLAAVVEQHSDDYGICWPKQLAPYDISVIALSVDDDIVWPHVEKVVEELVVAGFDVLVDDRDERAGVKFADADLIGAPVQIICGKRSIQNGEFEVKNRATGEKQTVSFDSILDVVKDM